MQRKREEQEEAAAAAKRLAVPTPEPAQAAEASSEDDKGSDEARPRCSAASVLVPVLAMELFIGGRAPAAEQLQDGTQGSESDDASSLDSEDAAEAAAEARLQVRCWHAEPASSVLPRVQGQPAQQLLCSSA